MDVFDQAVQVLGGKDGQAYQDSSLRGKVFSSIWRDFKGYFSVDSYRNTRVLDLERRRNTSMIGDHRENSFEKLKMSIDSWRFRRGGRYHEMCIL
ncbi:hypothetical protein E8L90_03320 [Brevibacillus antibioticus]|uniref:ORF6C domain-containing protein n=1 Tax=Brevibacillus antibioticus TaxID=2570228 RepID=A0A4U2Y2A1_9BACL|nr:hypothetical protein E8L90_03320 [Brevibacillus antibioticus]